MKENNSFYIPKVFLLKLSKNFMEVTISDGKRLEF